MIIQKTCKLCRKTVTVSISEEAYDMWQKGAHLQEVAPELSLDDREILISGICGPCYDNLFSDDEEEDDGK